MDSKVKLLLLAMALFAVQRVSADIYNGNCGLSGNNVTWSLDTETGILTISGSGKMASFYGTLPEGVTDYRTHKSHIKHVVFAPDITSIGYQAFYECNNLESVTMPSGNEEHGSTEIGTQAFYGCTSLNDITFRKLSGYTFGNNIFDNIPANGTIHYPYNGDYKNELIWTYFEKFHNWSWNPYLERLIIYSTTDGKPLNLSSYEGFGANKVKDIEYTGDNGERCIVFDNNVTAIPQDAFKGQSTLSSIIIPPYVTNIGALAFHSCGSLASINIPDGVTSIGHDAFHWCSSLTSITIPGSVTSTGYAAFVECDHLDTVIISSGVTSIDDYSFLRCTSLSSVTIPSSVTTIGESAFEGCHSLASITLPAGLNSIGAMAFHSCGSLDSITIPGSVTSIGHDAFHWCGSLTSITIPGSLTSTGFSAFNGCTNLSSVTISPGVTTIDDFSFFECTSLSSITIPSSVTYVGESAFERCSSLVSITLPSDDLTTIGDSAFYDCTNLNDITIKKAIGITLGTDVFGGTCTGVDSVKLYYISPKFDRAQNKRSKNLNFVFVWKRQDVRQSSRPRLFWIFSVACRKKTSAASMQLQCQSCLTGMMSSWKMAHRASRRSLTIQNWLTPKDVSANLRWNWIL